MKKHMMERNPVRRLMQHIGNLGAKTITAMAAALVAALLLFASAEIGIASAIGGVVVGGISAAMLRPHHDPKKVAQQALQSTKRGAPTRPPSRG